MILLVCKKSDTVQPCDTTRKVRFGLWLKICTVQSYVIDRNSKSNRWIKLKLYQKIPEVLVYVVVLIQMNKCLGRTCEIG
jgi:intracellular septation protein A